ncbi:protein MODIFIER OF SNC1 1-like isoform X3 [Juglans microcarpa x Juglans regia]|uniref:protein MODIFIER OF SNC1 1-like isoform X3 n=1 Tax=Juglans microcarpa x Juglans regia TaxID=2249226 RepID=UPI001B7DF77E|nr:protein MODIFIER OF SNC1 1-like isoform X3 [Juglans microcarpa x Juglans regia]
MTSSMLSGERRWASSSTRRGGMTVLGKVAVPKPINLPSQRLENHGLDPSVEIVPKGTHSWGSRSSSSTSNAWGSSTLSPRTDGGSGSPSLLSGRPSSGGSGTRPSTASSDRAHEPSVNNAWGQNSRPSSASGTLTSNQTSLTSLRPRSADNRPGSSQLSRFAEPLPENPGAWGAVGTSERLGVSAPKNDGFSLTSGDFPTLGSEKENFGKSTESQDRGSHSRPNSSSGGVAPLKERSGTSIAGDVSMNADAKSGIANSWRQDNPPYSKDIGTSGVEKWQADPQPYPNANIPHHFEAWHGPPVTNPPSGVWFRGPLGGPPYGPPVGPGGFPIEPFPYYRPQMPPTALASPQPGPPPGGGPRGHHPKNGDLYRPHIPDSYIRPGMPIRPGFYPSPVAYEGYYGGPMGYCNSNERDVPFMGMVAGPSLYNRFSTQNAPEPNNSLGRSGGYGSTGKTMVPEHVESGHPHDTRGPYKVLLKQQNDWDGKIEEKKWEATIATSAGYVEKGNRPGMSSRENDWRSDYGNDERMGLRETVPSQEISIQTYDNQRSSSVPVKAKSPESVGNTKAIDDISARNLESASTGLPEITDEGGRGFVYPEIIHASEITNPASREMGVSVGDKSLESTAASRTTISRKSIHDMQGRGGNRGQRGHNSQEVDGWQKKSRVIDSASLVSASRFETNSNVIHVHEHHTSVEASEKSASHHRAKDDRESTPVFDPSDYQSQRPKLRELEQRAKQLREEEEERTRKQMAKAHAKLEELDRRKHSMEGPTQNAEHASSDAIDNQQELNAVPPTGEGSASRVEQFPVLSCELPQEKPKSVNKESIVHNQSMSLHQNADSADVAYGNNDSHVHDGNAAKQKRMGYKQKQNLEKNSNVKLISPGTNEALKHHNDAVGKVTVSVGTVANETTLSCKSSLPVNSNSVAESSSLTVNATAVVESSLPHRKKNNRSVKNKHKVEAASSMATLPSSESKETNLVNASPECGKPNASDTKLDPNLVQSVIMSKDENLLLEQCSSLPTDDSHGRVNNSQWKSQHSRRTSRNPQVNRPAEKFHGDVIWAPVASHNKADADEASRKNVVEVISPSMKRDHQVQSNPKYKRAEIERYVPKPAAKEMAQQGNNQQLVASSINQTTSDERVGRADYSSPGSQPAGSAIVKVGLGLDSRNGDGRQNKQQGKSHGSWRQRGPAEFSVQSTQDGPSSYPSRNVQKSVEHYQSQLPDVDSVEEQQKCSDEKNAPDGWNIPDNSESVAPVAVTVIKDQRVGGRGKRHPFKGQKGMGNNNDLDQKKISSGETSKIDTQSSSIEMSQTHLPTTTENRGIGERTTAHWQPKSQAFAANYQQGSRPSSGRSVGAGVVWTNKKESTRQGAVPQTHLHDNRTGGLSQPHRDHDQSPSKKVDVEEPLDVGHQEAKRGRRVGSLRGRPHSPNEILVSPAEQAPETLDVRHEQRSSLGYRKSGHHNNNHLGRGHETRGDWNSSGQDSKHHNPPVNWERQRQTSHYEYQPVAPYNSNKSNSAEGPKDVAHNIGPRFKERSQNHSRRGGGGNSY